MNANELDHEADRMADRVAEDLGRVRGLHMGYEAVAGLMVASAVFRLAAQVARVVSLAEDEVARSGARPAPLDIVIKSGDGT